MRSPRCEQADSQRLSGRLGYFDPAIPASPCNNLSLCECAKTQWIHCYLQHRDAMGSIASKGQFRTPNAKVAGWTPARATRHPPIYESRSASGLLPGPPQNPNKYAYFLHFSQSSRKSFSVWGYFGDTCAHSIPQPRLHGASFAFRRSA
jgi:hypothetical protein